VALVVLSEGRHTQQFAVRVSRFPSIHRSV